MSPFVHYVVSWGGFGTLKRDVLRKFDMHTYAINTDLGIIGIIVQGESIEWDEIECGTGLWDPGP